MNLIFFFTLLFHSTTRQHLERLHKQVCKSNNRKQKEQSNAKRKVIKNKNQPKRRRIYDDEAMDDGDDVSVSDSASTQHGTDEESETEKAIAMPLPALLIDEEAPDKSVEEPEIQEVAESNESIPEFVNGQIERFEAKRVILDETVREWEKEIARRECEIESLYESIQQCNPNRLRLEEIIVFMKSTSVPISKDKRIDNDDPEPTNFSVDNSYQEEMAKTAGTPNPTGILYE